MSRFKTATILILKHLQCATVNCKPPYPLPAPAAFLRTFQLFLPGKKEPLLTVLCYHILTYSRYAHWRREPEVDELRRPSLMRSVADAVPSGVVSADQRSKSGVGALKSRLRGGAGIAG